MYCQKCGHNNPDDARYCQRCGETMEASDAPVPPKSPETNVPQPEAPQPEPIPATPPEAPTEYAGFWLRVVAAIIDGLLLSAFNWTVSFGIFDGGTLSFGPGALVGWLYFALMENSKHQGTLGKLAVGIKVTDIRGQRISFLRATGRHFGKWLSAIILFIGFMMAGFTQKKQALHDMLADCLVVKR